MSSDDGEEQLTQTLVKPSRLKKKTQRREQLSDEEDDYLSNIFGSGNELPETGDYQGVSEETKRADRDERGLHPTTLTNLSGGDTQSSQDIGRKRKERGSSKKNSKKQRQDDPDEAGDDDQIHEGDEGELERMSRKKLLALAKDKNRKKRHRKEKENSEPTEPAKKPKQRGKKVIFNQEQVEQDAVQLIESMSQAYFDDQDAYQAGLPAVKKLELLPKVVHALNSVRLQSKLIEIGVLNVISQWLEPIMPRPSSNERYTILPLIDIRKSLLKIIQDLSWELLKPQLPTSPIAKAMYRLKDHPNETAEIRYMIEKTVDVWIRNCATADY